MGVAVSCPRCGGSIRPPDLASSSWRCDLDGHVPPLHAAQHVGLDLLSATVQRAQEQGFPVWCPWPMPQGWMVTGLAWAGDDRDGLSATAIACTGPSPLTDGPGDVLLIAEDPAVGLGARLAGLSGPDPGPGLMEIGSGREAHAKVRVGGRPTPLWALDTPDDRSAYAGEARGRWLWVIAFPAPAGYLLTERLEVHDLVDWLPAEMVFGAVSPYLLNPV
jgi:hypothetical protein